MVASFFERATAVIAHRIILMISNTVCILSLTLFLQRKNYLSDFYLGFINWKKRIPWISRKSSQVFIFSMLLKIHFSAAFSENETMWTSFEYFPDANWAKLARKTSNLSFLVFVTIPNQNFVPNLGKFWVSFQWPIITKLLDMHKIPLLLSIRVYIENKKFQ